MNAGDWNSYPGVLGIWKFKNVVNPEETNERINNKKDFSGEEGM
jgi:hypothetical protein